MRVKRQRGGTLLIIITGTIVLTMLAYAILLMCQVLSRGRQAVSTVDAAVLSVARDASSKVSVNVVDAGVPEFSGLGENDSDLITLATYNRAAGKTLLSALNAAEFGDQASLREARHLKTQLDKLRNALLKKMQTSSELAASFDRMIAANPLKMASKKAIERVGEIEWSCVGEGDSSGMYFDPNSLSVKQRSLIEPFLSQDESGPLGGRKCLKGYEPITVAGITIEVLPLKNGKQPHLVSLTDFARGRDKHKDSLPTSLMIRSREASSHLEQQCAAIVGTMSQTAQRQANFDAAQNPNGFIMFTNLHPSLVSYGTVQLVSDGENDLFNKELFSPSRIVQSDNGVFTTDISQMAAWVAFNNGEGPDPRGSYNREKMRVGDKGGFLASDEDLEGIKSVECECTHTMYTGELGGPCASVTNLKKWAGNYRRWSVGDADPYSLSAFESAKYDVLVQRLKFSKTFQDPVHTGGPHSSGMKIFGEGVVYACPPHPVNFSQDGSAAELIEQYATRSCGFSFPGSGDDGPGKPPKLARKEIFDRIYQIACQIDPLVSKDELKKALNARKLKLGTRHILRKKNGKFVLEELHLASRPEVGGTLKYCVEPVSVPVAGCIVNSPGDANFTDAPFSWTGKNGESLGPEGWEHIQFGRNVGGVPHMFGGNCLAEVRFECGTRVPEFSCPN